MIELVEASLTASRKRDPTVCVVNLIERHERESFPDRSKEIARYSSIRSLVLDTYPSLCINIEIKSREGKGGEEGRHRDAESPFREIRNIHIAKSLRKIIQLRSHLCAISPHIKVRDIMTRVRAAS